MRIPILAGNWKMNKTIPEALEFVSAVREPLAAVRQVEVAVCASFVTLAPLAEALRGTTIKLGAQNVFWAESGAYTGEVSPLMLRGLVDLVIIGHSERRQYFGETDETVNKRLKAALNAGLTPIVCVGETLEQNQAGETEAVVSRQVRGAFADVTAEQAAGLIVAYEPVWAIGTGLAATPQQANDIIGGVVRASLAALYGDTVAQQIRIQYGGSVTPENCEELMSQPEIDGGLVGGASLKPASFIQLVQITARAKGLD